MSDDESYEYVTVEVEGGEATLRYKTPASAVEGSMLHDEDVSDWTEEEIRQLAADLLECPVDLVKVEYL